MSIETAFTQFPVLTTERLHLRRLQPTDADAVFVFKSQLEVSTGYGREPHASLDDTAAWLERFDALYTQQQAIIWGVALKDDTRVIGDCLLMNFRPEDASAELGYELHPAYHGQGLMHEAASAVLRYSFDELDLHRLEAVILHDNQPSQNLIRTLGFREEGRLRERKHFRGQFKDQLYFGLLQTEWRSRSAVDQALTA